MSVLGTRSKQLTAMTPRAVTQSRAVFFAASAMIYAITIVAATLTLNAYFSKTWDVQTFIQAARQFLDGGNPFDLYAQSRAAQTWPYAYPPLHAFVTAIFLWVGNFALMLPDYVWARVPALIADVAVGITLYVIVSRKTSDESLARIAMLLWLFNPVTFYDTVVQGHFESEWLLFVLLAYYWFENSRGVALPAIALAIAVLFKQVAILFAIPVWVFVLKTEGGRRKAEIVHPSHLHFPLPQVQVSLILHLLLFALITLAVCLPFLLYSDDFLYMNVTYVENVPVQTQSWIVALLALTRPARDAMTSDFFLIRYSTIVTLLAAIAISFFAARRGMSLYLTATLITVAFFLTSHKVMGYYYVMLFPFLFAEVLPRRRFGIVLAAIVLTSYIALSPYFAPWANPDHIWIYAILGTLNSVVFVWLVTKIWTRTNAEERGNEKLSALIRVDPRSALFGSLGLFACAALAALIQPSAPNGGSPIRVPLIAPGAEATVLAAFGAFIALTMVGLWTLSRKLENVPRAAWAIVLIFAPLFFVVYYLTKESTAVFEFVLKGIGV